MKLIAITGYARAGKDTVAELMIEQRKRERFGILKFTTKLHIECAAAWGVPLETFTNENTKDTPIESLSYKHCNDLDFLGEIVEMNADMDWPNSPRDINKFFSEYKKANIDPNHWVHPVASAMLRMLREGVDTVLVPGLRFPIEAQFVKRVGGVIWRVDNGGGPHTNHVSETVQAKVKPNLRIENFGSIDDLRKQVENARNGSKVSHINRLALKRFVASA